MLPADLLSTQLAEPGTVTAAQIAIAVPFAAFGGLMDRVYAWLDERCAGRWTILPLSVQQSAKQAMATLILPDESLGQEFLAHWCASPTTAGAAIATLRQAPHPTAQVAERV